MNNSLNRVKGKSISKNQVSIVDEIRINKATKKMLIKTVFVLFICVIAFIFSIRYKDISNAKKLEIIEVQKNITNMKLKNDTLEIQLKSEMNLQDIYNKAVNKLGMKKLTNEQIVVFNVDKGDYFKQYKTLSR